jgi:enamine deaminase RidA (YjgF/YER057c/UK114 family)
MLKLLSCLLLLALPSYAAAPLAKSIFHLNEQVEKDIGYSQAVRVGDTLYISGSIGAGDMASAVRQAYNELKATLKAHGLDFSHVVKENVYTTNLDDFIKNKTIRKEYYAGEEPAATWVQVSRLYDPSHVVEVELIAVFPKP